MPPDWRMSTSRKMCHHPDYLSFSPPTGIPALHLLLIPLSCRCVRGSANATHPSGVRSARRPPRNTSHPPYERAALRTHVAAGVHPVFVLRPEIIVLGREIAISGREIVILGRETGLGTYPGACPVSVSTPPRSPTAAVSDTARARTGRGDRIGEDPALFIRGVCGSASARAVPDLLTHLQPWREKARPFGSRRFPRNKGRPGSPGAPLQLT